MMELNFAAANWLLPVLLLTVVVFAPSQHASAQPGWLSIDCGAPSPYVDDKGISWVPDDAYITGGATATVALDPASSFTATALTTLRYFPDSSRTRYCYQIPTKKSQLYLIRWMAYHGGYDANPAFKFDVSFDVYVNATLTFTPSANIFAGEGVFRAPNDNIHFCMFRTSPGDNPFLSSLELRPLDNTMYATVREETCLIYLIRANCGPVMNSILRYPDDPYDRFWLGYSDPSFTTITAASVVDSGFAVDKPPPAVMNTALNSSVTKPISLELSPGIIKVDYLVNVYLAELQTIPAGQTRVFDILVNGVLVAPNVNVYTKAQNALYKPIEYSTNTSTLTPTGKMSVNFSAAATSTLGPIVNAVEIFTVHTIESRTLAADETAVESVKQALGLVSWTGDPCLFVPYDWLSCNASSTPRVTAVRLSKYNLTGSIPVGLRDLNAITVLALDNNKLTGAIPEWLAMLPNLKELYLQNNDFTGSLPKALLSNTLLKLQVDGNPRLCVNATSCPTGGKSSNVGIIVGVVVGVLVAVVIAVLVGICCCSKWRQVTVACPQYADPGYDSETGGSRSRYSQPLTFSGSGSRYTLAEVMAATNNHEKVLGRGGFGPVYYGRLASGQEVAVKVADKGSSQGSREFMNEVALLGRVHHKNLVSLLGYCDEGDNLILLYEYMPLGTIQEHLYGIGKKERAFFLDWPTRLQIALQAAQGLEYLHVGCSPAIFHRDVKSNSILLGERMIAKVADFGLSKSTNSIENVTHVSTMVKGTIGYLDPDYLDTSQLTEKTDVYGFGIVLLELICARPPFVFDLPEDQRRIDKWVKPHLKADLIEKIVDPALNGRYSPECMWKVAKLAIQSVEPKGVHRPRMSDVVQELREALQMEGGPPPVNSINSNSLASPSQGFVFDVMPHSNNETTPSLLCSSELSSLNEKPRSR